MKIQMLFIFHVQKYLIKVIMKLQHSGHLGIYGLKKSLNNFCELKSFKELENIEKLEQLRAIDNGFKIAMVSWI